MSKTLKHGVVAPGDVVEHQLIPEASGGESVLIKALSTNVSTIRIGKKTKVDAANGFPLDPGDSLTMDLGDALQVWYQNTTAADKLAWVVTGA